MHFICKFFFLQKNKYWCSKEWDIGAKLRAKSYTSQLRAKMYCIKKIIFWGKPKSFFTIHFQTKIYFWSQLTYTWFDPKCHIVYSNAPLCIINFAYNSLKNAKYINSESAKFLANFFGTRIFFRLSLKPKINCFAEILQALDCHFIFILGCKTSAI